MYLPKISMLPKKHLGLLEVKNLFVELVKLIQILFGLVFWISTSEIV